jgi:hypothetical protein
MHTTNRRRRPASTLLALLVVTTGLVVASAARIPLASANLAEYTINGGTGAPVVYTWSNFTGATNTNLNGAALNGGGTWTVHVGTWVLDNANRGKASASTALANMSTNVGQVNAAVEAVLTFPVTARRAGLTFNDDSNNGMFVVYTDTAGGSLLLYKAAGAITQIAAVTGVGVVATADLRVEAFDPTVKVYLNGTLWITYTLTAAERTTFKAAGNTRYGLIADSDANTRFDDFRVTG